VTAIRNARTAITNWSAKTSLPLRKQLGFVDSVSQYNYINELYKQLKSAWFRYFISFDPSTYLRNLTTKVLAMNGSKDIQVIASSNLAGIEKNIRRSKVKIFEKREMPGLNHLFQHCTKCTIEEYAQLEETFSPDTLMIITEWLNKNVGK